nr:integrating conjugative element protein PilL, PFGI-1 class [Escherichia coli 9.0111]
MKKRFILSGLTVCLLMAGCQSTQKLQQRDAAMPVPSVTVNRNVQPASPDVYSQAPEVVRYDRYLLVSTEPQAVQRDPLSQVIDIRIPSSLKPTVADAMRYALKQSGYTLCATGPANGVLYRQPLPAVQYQPGPLRLRTALQLMAGRHGNWKWMMCRGWSATVCVTVTSYRSASWLLFRSPFLLWVVNRV